MTFTRALSLSAAVSVLTLGLAAAPATAQTSPAQQTPRTGGDAKSSMDRGSAKFMKDAAMSDLFEIEAAKIALQKSRNDGIKRFAQMMLDEHQKMSTQLKSAAGGQSAAAAQPAQLDRKHTQKLEQLRNAPAANFDRMYMESQVEGHREALKLHQDYSKNGDNASLKQVAGQAVPHVQQHLQQAQALHRQTAEVPRAGTGPGAGTPSDRSPSGQAPAGQQRPMQQAPQPQQQRMPPGQRQ